MKFRLIAAAFLAIVLLVLYVIHTEGGGSAQAAEGGESVQSAIDEQPAAEVVMPVHESEPGTEGNKKFNF